MGLTDILKITVYIVGIGAVGFGANELRKKYVNWAEENKFYDKELEKEDMKDEKKPINYNQSN